MKKVFCLLVIVLVSCFSLSGCGSESQADEAWVAPVSPEEPAEQPQAPLTKMTTDFSVGFSATTDGLIAFSAYPKDFGMAVGDGFLINFRGIYYFLPEGEKLELPTDRQLRFSIARAFKTEAGYVIGGNNEEITLNPDRPQLSEYPAFPADIQEMGDGSIRSWLLEPILTADFQTGKIRVSGTRYAAPPQYIDLFLVTFEGNPRAGIEPVEYEAAEGAYLTPPSDSLLYCSAVAAIYDPVNNRILISGPAGLNFNP
ncbi:MAG: hypothetical protein UY41_C0018G0016 [Candidatus Moranbacteria bacterium GW2011_GWE1_49_15]|nr:MAG: hypothetical protein UX75_C0040G0008 [Candidatus Moranbacteria bacterium GW2011_GWE2_47_10]KKW06658.1 MAG: hypothetical protein UY41_C0018G0016 [Candidatus Moranbacteria bacterium GW2011_GWE1_49_15]HBP00711.1 hypothetical protein [Candidatus Moranbacteria bacterium]